ncbi:MAG TPA: hypothetical protein VEG37_04570 [Burkholderiales bacterium]|nr:hypothetical protein [Burkholderiales bacterium]HXZ96308.1 hypothetical protein [Burkholderiales bacterium]
MEERLSGLNILSSAYGSVRWETGICEQREQILTPIPACAHFELATPLGGGIKS